jgi:hypothetical protein
MSFQHQLQRNRFELKYLVDEQGARALRDYGRSYLVPDEHADPDAGYAYPIHSLYLDGPGYALYYGTVHGHKNRFKLRIRYYDGNPDQPVFFEIKRRVNDVILKKRAAVKRTSMMRLLAGHWPEGADLHKPDDSRAFEALRHFLDLRNRVQADGRVIVSYRREAWVTPYDDSVRMTFDRDLVSTRYEGSLVCGDFEHAIRPELAGVILELKFTDRFPTWMRDMVRVFNLQRCSVPKYVHCLQALRPREFRTNVPQVGATL